jgi:hypothetical protein
MFLWARVHKNLAWVSILRMLLGKVQMPIYLQFGFSIVRIVEDNSKEKMAHFVGITGQSIHQCYMHMSYDTTDKDGHFKTLPLFTDIGTHTPKYMFTLVATTCYHNRKAYAWRPICISPA